jgi:hypothetical protein
LISKSAFDLKTVRVCQCDRHRDIGLQWDLFAHRFISFKVVVCGKRSSIEEREISDEIPRLNQDQISASSWNLVGDKVAGKIYTLLYVKLVLRMSMESQRQRATITGGKVRDSFR